MNTFATIKKYPATICLLALLFAVAGCGGSSGPSGTAQSFMRHLSEGNTEQAVSMVFIPEQAPAGAEQKLQARFERASQMMNEQDGGIEDLEVIEESVNGEEATVQFRVTYGNGDTEEENINLVQKEGAWKINVR